MVAPDVLAAIPEDDQDKDFLRPDRFRTSTGIMLKLKAVPPMLIMDIQSKFEIPEPPKVKNLEKGEGDDAPLEDNPNDPTYLRAVAAYNRKVAEASNAVVLTRGTELLYVPDGIEKPDDESWSDDIEELTEGLSIPKVGKRRYYCWLKYVALASMDDFQSLLNKLTVFGGVTLEEDVTVAEKSFRTDQDGNTTEGVPASEEV